MQQQLLYCSNLMSQPQADGTFHFRTTFLPSEEDIGQ
jgi:hypothetical protein